MAVYVAGAADVSGAGDSGKRAIRVALKAAGPLISVGAVAFLVAWGNGVSFGTGGAIPEVSAGGAPFKRLPQDPGGIRSPFEGRAINTLIGGNSAKIADRESIRLAPKPAQLHVLDLSPRDLAARRNAGAASRYGFMGLPRETAPAQAPERLARSEPVAREVHEPEIPAAGTSDISSQQEPAAQEMYAAQETYAPMRRSPELARMSAAAAENTPGLQSAGSELDAAAVPTGTPVAQLGDYATRDAARRAWRMLHSTFTNLLGGRDWLIQETTSGGRPLFRLRVLGFADRTGTGEFCARLNARQTQCIPTIMR